MVKILHLSDLHFCTDARANNMKNVLLKEACAVQSLGKGEKLLIITGDFHNYTDDNYSAAENFIRELVNVMGLEMAQDVFVIPGNHDVGNDSTLPPLLEQDDSNWKNHNKAAIKMLKSGDMSFIAERLRAFRPYSQFVQRIGIYDPAWDEDYPAQVHVRCWREKLNILHLNTALVADGKTKINQITDTAVATADETWEKYYRDDLPALALGHNSFFDLKKAQQNALKAMFKLRNVSAYLCGDTHKVDLDTATQLIALESGARVGRLQIPNIVGVKAVAEDGDDYSDFGYCWHEWDMKTGRVYARYQNWKPEFGAETKHNESGDGWYIMRSKKLTSTGTHVSKTADSAAVSSSTEQPQKDYGIICDSELEKKYYQYILQQSSEIEIKGLPINQEDIGRFYKLKQLFIPEHFEQIESMSIADDPDPVMDFGLSWNNRDSVINLLTSDKPFKNLVLADPGSGKTTLIKWIASTCCTQETANEEERHIQSLSLFPIWIRCRDIKGEQPTVWNSILDVPRLAEWLPNRSVEQFTDLIAKQLADGNALLLIDGVDEIDDSRKRTQFIEQIGVFMRHYPLVNVVVTSRSKGYNIASQDTFSDFTKWGIQPLSSDDISLLCKKWYFLVDGENKKSEEKAHNLVKQINSNVSLKKLASNPLMLTTLLIIERRIGRLPNKRAGLYYHAIDVLLESWNKDVHETLNLNDAKYQLAFVAFHMMTDKQRRRSNRTQITKSELQEILRTVRSEFSNFVYTHESIDRFLEKVEQRSAVLYKVGVTNAADGHEEPLYSFQHLSFEEYLAAYAITEGCYPGANEENRDGKILFENLLNPEMREVIALTGAINPHCAANISKRIIHLLKEENNKEDIDSLRSLLLQLIADEVSLSPDIVKESFDVLFHSSIYGKDQSFLAQILTGKFRSVLIEYFIQVDDIYHHRVMGWSSIPTILTDDAFNPVEYYLQHRTAENPVLIANAMCFLANGCWIRGKKYFNDVTFDTLETIRKDILKGLTSRETDLLYGVLDVVYMCVPGIWDTLKNISEYYNALVYYINQTSRIPDILDFTRYDKKCFIRLSIASMGKLKSESIQKLLEYINENGPWSQSDFLKVLTIVLFVSISCGDEQEQYITQIYNLVIKVFREEQIRLRSCMRKFISFVEEILILNSGTFSALPEKIGVAFNHFYGEAVDALNTDIFNEHIINEKPSAFDLNEIIKIIDQRIAELERKEQ